MTHELDENGDVLHVDIDPFIPTGTCAICSNTVQETEPPGMRALLAEHEEPLD